MTTSYGFVKFWLKGKGYGFVTDQTGHGDVFCHASKLVEVEELTTGDVCEYELEENDKGWRALSIRKLAGTEGSAAIIDDLRNRMKKGE